MPEVDARFEQMGGVAVPQGLDTDRLAEAELRDDLPHPPLHAAGGHRAGRRGRVHSAAAEGGKHEPRMAMSGPMRRERRERAGWQRDEPILGSLATVDVDEHAGAVDVAEFQGQPFLEPQAQGVDGPEEGAVVRRADGVEEPMHFGDGQDVGQRLVLGDAELEERGPVARHAVGVEELDAAVGDLQGAGGEPAVVLAAAWLH